jgi:hypothetical protein
MPSPSLQASVNPWFIFTLQISVAFDPIATYSYTMFCADTRNKFLAVFEAIREELVAHMKSEKMPEDAIAWFSEVTSYVSPLNVDVHVFVGSAINIVTKWIFSLATPPVPIFFRLPSY